MNFSATLTPRSRLATRPAGVRAIGWLLGLRFSAGIVFLASGKRGLSAPIIGGGSGFVARPGLRMPGGLGWLEAQPTACLLHFKNLPSFITGLFGRCCHRASGGRSANGAGAKATAPPSS